MAGDDIGDLDKFPAPAPSQALEPSTHLITPESAPELKAKEMAVTGILWRNIKYISLIILVAQNAALVLTLRYSRTVTGGKMYLASTAVVLTELLKFIISITMIFYNSDFDVQKTTTLLYVEIIEKAAGTLKVSVPSVLYTIQNNLLYVALSHLNAATFQVRIVVCVQSDLVFEGLLFVQVTYQLKILTTALFSVILLRKSLSSLKWFSLVVLMIAVALVQVCICVRARARTHMGGTY